MHTKTFSKQSLADAIRELAGLLGQAGRGEAAAVQAAAVLDDEAAAIASGAVPRGLSALRRLNVLRAGLAAAADTADKLERGAPERVRLRALAADIGRALQN